MPAPRVTPVLATILLLTGCASSVAGPSAAAPLATTIGSSLATHVEKGPPPAPPTSEQLCAAALPGRTVLAWGHTTVEDLRTYRFGPPAWKPPLADAFPGRAVNDPATWCATRDARHATSWWGVAAGEAEMVITISGPEESAHKGEATRPPQVP